ncbi:MAG: glycoside hydrolase family 15 protein, partial [Dehalococcoidia bacterium]
MAYKPISDYGVIGDMHSAALVGSDGSVDWLCFPRFDSPSVFAAVLDDRKGGCFRISPSGEYRGDHQYLPDSNILVTNFSTDSGVASLTDFMSIYDDVSRCKHELVRIVRCQSGSVDMEVEFKPRLGYARSDTQITVQGRLALARRGDDTLSLSAGVPLSAGEGAARGRFTLRAGEWTAFLLRWHDDSPPSVEDSDVYGRLGRTEAFWRFVTHDWHYLGRWEEMVRRSMLALHLLLYVPTGGVCGAATTSLPERIGGERNWDYRFSWLRDAAFTMDIFHRLGHTTYTRPFMEWLAGLSRGSDGPELHTLYGIGHEADPRGMEEYSLEHLEGYRGSGPVRVGNAAFHQLQIDVFGEVLLSFDSYHRAGGIIDVPMWGLLESLVESAIDKWQQPDNGIWEFRTEPQHFVYSKLMAWVAVDRGLRLARVMRRPVDFGRWRRARGAIRAEILRDGWNPQRGAFVQHYGSASLDASALFMPMVGFLPAHDPRMRATSDLIQQELGLDGLLRRYSSREVIDGLPEDEGAFTVCSLWLAGSLVSGDRIDEAQAILERVLSLRNRVGLFS